LPKRKTSRRCPPMMSLGHPIGNSGCISDKDPDVDQVLQALVPRSLPPRTILVSCRYFIFRGVAQSGSAPALGAGCRRFESSHPDQFWRLGRVVYCIGLENRRGVQALPWFESQSLRQFRGVAQSGSVSASGVEGRRFESGHPDQINFDKWEVLS